MSSAARVLTLSPPAEDRGALITADQIAQLFGEAVSPAWVRRNVPHKVTFGRRTVRWYENDVRAYLESRRSAA